jgi:hypothetical protein
MYPSMAQYPRFPGISYVYAKPFAQHNQQ